MSGMHSGLIAPCGMNCALCSAYQRGKKPCDGCNGKDEGKPAYCLKCVMRNCETVLASDSGLCYECGRFPCKRLRQLDARYRGRYHMSMIENLTAIRDGGMDAFLEQEAARWTCQGCGALVSVHREACSSCGTPYMTGTEPDGINRRGTGRAP